MFNLFADNFHVWSDSVACDMNDTAPYTAIGWGKKAKSYSINEFVDLTNKTITENAGYDSGTKTAATPNGVLDTGAIVEFDIPISLNQLDIQ